MYMSMSGKSPPRHIHRPLGIIKMKIISTTSLFLILCVFACNNENGDSNKLKELYSGNSKSEVIESKSQRLVNNDFIYDFFNENILKGDSLNEEKWTKLSIASLGHNGMCDYLIRSMDSLLAPKDIEFMISKIDNTSWTWDCSKLKTTNCLDPEVVDSIFSIKREVLETENGNQVIDAWEIFKDKFGNGGIHRYSIPIYNLDKTVILIGHSWQGHWTLGFGEICVFRKINRKWTNVTNMKLWIS